jgi:hypothetical protein
MTEQLSAEAINVAKAHSRDEWGDDHGGWYTLAQAIEALIARRVSAETERWQNRDRQRMAQISTLQETVQSFQSARAERPAPNRHWHEGPPYCERPAPEGPQQGGYVIEVEFDDGDEAQRAYDAIERLLGEMGQLGTLGMRPLPSALASTGEQPDCGEEPRCEGGVPLGTMGATCPKCGATDNDPCGSAVVIMGPHSGEGTGISAAVADYTERAREIVGEWTADEHRELRMIGKSQDNLPGLVNRVATALSAVASERDAAAIRAFGERAWSDSEEVAYQAGVSDARARLQEPDVREAVEQALEFYLPHRAERTAGADAVLVVIKGILK